MVIGVTNANTLNDSAQALLELAAAHNTIAKSGGVATGMDDTASATPVIIANSRPWVDPPEGFQSFAQSGKGTFTGVPPESVILASLVVPDGFDGVINAVSWNYSGGGFVQGSGDLQAQILRNGASIQNYQNILVEMGTFQIAKPISPIRIYSGQTIMIIVNHLSNPLIAGDLVGWLQGYYYPSKG